MSEEERVLAEMLNKMCFYYDGGFCTSQNSPCNQECGYGSLAQNLYNAGYRKVDGTHYVSMEWHDEQVQHAQDEIEKLKLQLQHAEENEEVLTKNAEKVAKQAVRDFAEYLQEYAKECEETGYDGISAEDIEEKMQEFLKKLKRENRQ